MNFSLKKTPSANALRLLRQLDSDVELWARDLNSQRRAESFLQREVQVAPDIAMFMTGKLDDSVAEAHLQIIHARQDNAPVVGLVVNAHFNSWSSDLRMPLSDYFKAIVVRLASQGIHVMLIAHDIRDWPGDIELIDRIVKDMGANPYVHKVVPSSARAAKALISCLDLCITSRMHAGVAALSSGVPAIGLDYVDKFTGQFEWYGAESNVIPWLAAIDATVVLQMADAILTNVETERTMLVNSVSRLRAVSPKWVPRI
ncbi:polysaccharide pyruvyl transferase family protein [Arthrobacter alpinus]|nr:polysaccharide pyruvyl transferase family protein [Arthrobacter alpinus]